MVINIDTMTIPSDREGLKDLMKSIVADIGRLELERRVGGDAPYKEIQKLQKAFRKLNKIYKDRYYKLI